MWQKNKKWINAQYLQWNLHCDCGTWVLSHGNRQCSNEGVEKMRRIYTLQWFESIYTNEAVGVLQYFWWLNWRYGHVTCGCLCRLQSYQSWCCLVSVKRPATADCWQNQTQNVPQHNYLQNINKLYNRISKVDDYTWWHTVLCTSFHSTSVKHSLLM
jgi:hypothetical protein